MIPTDDPANADWFEILSDAFVMRTAAYDQGRRVIALSSRGRDKLVVMDPETAGLAFRIDPHSQSRQTSVV